MVDICAGLGKGLSNPANLMVLLMAPSAACTLLVLTWCPLPAVPSLTHQVKSCREGDLPFTIHVLKVWIDIARKKFCPVPPVMLPCCTSWYHNSSVGVFVDSRAQTCPIVAFCSQHKFQDASGVRGKHLWNSVRKRFGIRNSLNECDAKSAILFMSPSTWSVVSGDARQYSIQSARIWRSCTAMVALVESSLDAQVTVGVLSHQHTTCACVKSVHSSRTIQWSSRPIISRSEFKIEPLGLSCIIICCWTSNGNSTLQTMGGSFLTNQTKRHQILFGTHHNIHQNLPVLEQGLGIKLVLS